LILLLAASTAGSAADLNYPSEDSPQILRSDALREALFDRAVLYSLRAAFDVIESRDIPGLLQIDRAQLVSSDRASRESGAVREDLLAEGSYYIVSLRYLVEFGGANWPANRSGAEYERDAANLLETLQGQWLDAVLNNGDPLTILRQVDLINAWTQGYAILPAELDHFGDIESLVAQAMR